jgi:hypothetical protein
MWHHTKWLAATTAGLAVAALGAPAAARPQGDDRVTPDASAGSYSRLDGSRDALHDFCGTSRRSQAEPAVAVNPRNPNVIVAGAADPCYGGQRQYPISQSQGWLGLYRSTDGGGSWKASMTPGSPGDATIGWPVQNCGQADATMAFDRQGRLFYGALCPDLKGDQALVDFRIVMSTFDQDGSRYVRTVEVDGSAQGTTDPSTSTDKPNVIVDITGGRHDGNVYVAYSACPVLPAALGCFGDEGTIEVARSTDHGKTFQPPVVIGGSDVGRPNFADVVVAPDGAVYVTATTMDASGAGSDVLLARSVDGGATFTPFTRVAHVKPFNSAAFAGTGNRVGAADEKQHNFSAPCGDGAFACSSGFTFSPIRTLSAVAADDDGVHVAWSAQLASGQAKVFVQSSPDGVSWPRPPVVVDPVREGHQWYPDIASADGVLRVVFYDSRADRAYAPNRPPGNTATGMSSGPSVDTYEARSLNGGRSWVGRRLSTVSQAPGLNAQMGARAPWLGDYLYVSAVPGGSYAVWADSRDVVRGVDARGGTKDGFDVAAACHWLPATEDLPGGYPFVSPASQSDCLSQGGLDVNIYGASLRSP